ncbi:MATE family efflux transporter [Laribacter hongkongensis]|uniref:MATE family efflux transporter n=1 Tax=Laribacter hongkongensis TaxID=168471 RepID=UPI001EFC4A50|nr:MATE family efflux transporter [Laribacter hongkongensis]MCG9053855.1 MATE family efflux transporter [Laribacter hongkongensis]
MPSAIPAPPRRAWRTESSALLRLATPMMIAQMAQVATGFVDTVMAGRVSPDDLAAVSIGSSILITVFLTLSGVIMALNPLIAHQLGARQFDRIGPVVRQGFWVAAGLGLFGLALMFALMPWLPGWLSLETSVADKVNGYLAGAALGVPGILLYRVLHAYSSSVNQTRPIMLVSLAALALNVPLNYMLIHGLFGLPALGGAGCGWATGIVFWFSFVALALYTRYSRAYDTCPVWQRLEAPSRQLIGQVQRLGLPIALSFFLEVSTFTFVTLLIARLGSTVVAGHQIVINFTTLTYMVPQCLAMALTVRVGHALGANNPLLARFRSQIGILLGAVTAIASSTLILFLRTPIAELYTPDPQVVALAASLMLFAVFYQFFDAIQTIATGALRGYKSTTGPMLVHLVVFWGLGLGGGSWLGLNQVTLFGHDLPTGAYGFWVALTLSLTLAAFILGAVLLHVSRQKLNDGRQPALHEALA